MSSNSLAATAIVPQPASRGVWLATRVLSVLMAAIWVFFGIGWLRATPEVVDAMHHLGFPMYMTVPIGLTHMLGGLGLLVPDRPRLTQWVFAGLTYDLVLAAISHLASHDAVSNALHPVVLLVITAVLYGLRRRTGDALWAAQVPARA